MHIKNKNELKKLYLKSCFDLSITKDEKRIIVGINNGEITLLKASLKYSLLDTDLQKSKFDSIFFKLK